MVGLRNPFIIHNAKLTNCELNYMEKLPQDNKANSHDSDRLPSDLSECKWHFCLLVVLFIMRAKQKMESASQFITSQQLLCGISLHHWKRNACHPFFVDGNSFIDTWSLFLQNFIDICTVLLRKIAKNYELSSCSWHLSAMFVAMHSG